MKAKQPKLKTEIQLIPVALNPIIANTKIESSKAEQHAMAFAPAMQEYIILSAVISDLDRVNPSEIDAKRAREARLKMVKIRTGAEEIKDLRKEGIKAEGDLIQALYNVVKNSCLITETEFSEIERHQEREEAKRQAELSATRIELLLPYGTDTTYLPLGKFTDEQFDKILANEKLLFEAKKAELERLEAVQIAQEAEAKRLEAERLQLEIERKEAERLENERMKKELAVKEALLQKERKTAADKLEEQRKQQAVILEKQQAAARIERDKQLAELRKQQEATQKAQAELQAKKDKEAKELADKKTAELAALAAPDKIKIRALYEAIKSIHIPDLQSDPGKDIAALTTRRIKELLVEIANESKKLL